MVPCDPPEDFPVMPEKILLNGELYTLGKHVKPGKYILKVYIGEDFEKVEKSILIPPGEGMYIFHFKQVRLKRRSFAIHSRLFDKRKLKTIDGIKYKVKIYVDGKPVEYFTEAIRRTIIRFYFYAPKKISNVQIIWGFYRINQNRLEFYQSDIKTFFKLPLKQRKSVFLKKLLERRASHFKIRKILDLEQYSSLLPKSPCSVHYHFYYEIDAKELLKRRLDTLGEKMRISY